jgi:type-F conjugative transfer system pilin assembly protein TrbC
VTKGGLSYHITALAAALFLATAFPFICTGDPGTHQGAETTPKGSAGDPYQNPHLSQMREEAESIYREVITDRKDEIQGYKDQVKYDPPDVSMVNSPVISHDDPQRDRRLLPHEKIYIFISSSLPRETLSNYARAAHRLADPNVVLVLRGCIGGCTRIKPTIQFVHDIIAPPNDEELPSSFEIDPNLFRYYGIEKVPAILFAAHVSTELPGQSEGREENLTAEPDAYLLYGDVSLDYALEAINREAENPRLKSLMTKLRSGWYAR